MNKKIIKNKFYFVIDKFKLKSEDNLTIIKDVTKNHFKYKI